MEARDEAFRDFIKETLGTGLFPAFRSQDMDSARIGRKYPLEAFACSEERFIMEIIFFAKGACAAGKERLEDKILKGYRYMSPALVLKDVGMEMRVMGAPAYYPLIEAGKNWYECKAGCELILDDITELVFVVGTFGEKHKKKVIMGLPGLPERPNKTTRLSLALAYVSQKKCRVVVKDLGFGEMFPSSGKVWDELVEW